MTQDRHMEQVDAKLTARRSCTGLLDMLDTDCVLFAGEVQSPPMSPVQIEACHGRCTWIVLLAGLTWGLLAGWGLCLLRQRYRWIAPLLRNAGRPARMDHGVEARRGALPDPNDFGEIE